MIKRIALSIAVVLLFLFVAFTSVCLVLCLKNPNPDRPEEIANNTGYVQVYGRNLYDEEGKLLQLKGINLGNWFVQEPWMAVSSVGDYDTGIYTQTRGLAAMKDNPNLTDEQIDELCKLYIDTYITEEDFAVIAEMGLNCVRINFTYLNITLDGKTLRQNAFEKLDWALDQCEKYNLYAVLDLHGAIGSQNMDHHSGNDADFDLYGNPENRSLTIKLWETIAERYKDSKVVAAYDLLNEPRSSPYKYTGREQFDFYDELYRAIRKTDKHHVMIMECFTFPTHGVSEKYYDWENVCYSYHIYNLTSLSQKTCLYFYKALHNLKDYNVPIFIGEWCAWGNEQDWNITMDFFDELGWSYCSWTYKTNRYFYKNLQSRQNKNWGIFELDMPPVDVSSATYQEISNVWGSVSTVNAQKTKVYDIYKERFSN